jgi:hypothetical protein
MPRKKNTESSPALTLGATEDTQIINSADLEAKEADLLSDQDPKEEPEAIEEGTKESISPATTSEEAENKPKRQRRSRKANPPELSANENLELSKEVAIAKETVEITMNTMVAQFNTIKELTTGVNAQLEKMNGLIKEMSPTQSSNLEELVKPQVSTQFITKFATAASLVAMLLSILSLSMSQSARQTVLSASQQIAAKESSNEIALANKEAPKKSSFTSNLKALTPFKRTK